MKFEMSLSSSFRGDCSGFIVNSSDRLFLIVKYYEAVDMTLMVRFKAFRYESICVGHSLLTIA